MKAKILASLLVIFAVVLSTGTAYAVSPFEGADSSVNEFPGAVESSMSRSFVLDSSIGDKWSLNLAFGCVLYGKVKVGTNIFPAYGFIFGNEMVLWQDPEGIATDSVAFTGKWDFKTMKWDGFGVNYPGGTVVPVEMWVAGAGAKPGEETENGQNPKIAQSDAASKTQDSEMSQVGAPSGEKVKIVQNPQSPFGDLSGRGAICYEDSYGHTWDLDLAFGCIYYGTMTSGLGTHPAYGFIFDDEMFLWWNGPGGEYADSFVDTCKYDSIEQVWLGTWVNYPAGNSGTVSLWSCDKVILDLPGKYEQETRNWCWAATLKTIMHYGGRVIPQCNMANYLFGQTDCCDTTFWCDPYTEPCCHGATTSGMCSVLSFYTFSSDPGYSPLTWSEIKTEIGTERRPFDANILWKPGLKSGHALTMYGYEDSTTDHVYLWDPWPGNGDVVYEYNYFVDNSDFMWGSYIKGIHM